MTTNTILVNPNSFRDPHGFVFSQKQRIFRGITSEGLDNFKQVRATGFIKRLIDSQFLLEEWEVPLENFSLKNVAHILEHPKLELITYPFEWTFSALKAAALLHLDLQLMGLNHGVSFRDASAYNIQFIGSKPIFIDHLSFQPYSEGEYWLGQKQFTEQFLNPLLLQAYTGFAFNDLYRGSPQGISSDVLVKLVPGWHKWIKSLFLQVLLPQLLQTTSVDQDWMKQHPLPQKRYRLLLTQLRRKIERLTPRKQRGSKWSNYQDCKHYQLHEKEKKAKFVNEFIGNNKIESLCDLGANEGCYSEVALDAGAKLSVAMENDSLCLENIYHKQKSILPLNVDLMNLSPGMGWRGESLQKLTDRLTVDGVLALGILHHLALGNNAPLGQVISWIIGLGKYGVIEFIPKSDPMCQTLLALRGDIFPNYSLELCINALLKEATILNQQQVTASGRILISYRRNSQ